MVSDCGAISQIYTAHHYTKTPEEAVAAGLKAGVDQDCGPYYDAHGREAYSQGLITDADLDLALSRQFGTLLRLGYFDPAGDQPYRHIGLERLNSAYNKELALRVALQSLVLLKNDAATLPYALSSGGSIALIGPNSDATGQLLGNYDAPAPYIISVLQALSTRGAKVTHVKGCDIASNSTTGFAAAVAAAQDADVVLFVGGLDQSQEAEGHDRTTLTLPGQQGALIKAVAAAAKKPIAVVMLGGGQCDLSELKANARVGAILSAFYPGQSGGEAIVQVVTGQHSPSGRLPSTQYPASYVEAVPMTDQSFRPSSTNPGRTYKFYTGEAVYPFGYGLSYATFRYAAAQSALRAPITRLLGADPSPLAYSVNVTNTGSVASDVTVLAYLTFNASAQYPALSPPLKQLFDFAFLPSLAPGATREVYFQLTARALRQVDERGHEWVVPGSYGVHINEGEARGAVELEGEVTLVRKWEGDDVVEAPRKADPLLARLANLLRSSTQ